MTDSIAPSATAKQPADEHSADAVRPAGPSFTFFGVVAAVALLADAASKAWAEVTLSQLSREQPSIILVEDVLTFTLAYNKGGAFGMFADGDSSWRRPFFLLMSMVAVVFIVSLYRKLAPEQRALRWGLPLVLGGALGNLADRITKGKVVDFVDYSAGWVETMNEIIVKIVGLWGGRWHVTDHWPTFNVADICICIGVGLMAIDMFFSSRGQDAAKQEEPKNGKNEAADGEEPVAS